MIQKLSHATVYVVDQDRAKDFYVGKLGFEVRTDQSMGGFRWLTVGIQGAAGRGVDPDEDRPRPAAR